MAHLTPSHVQDLYARYGDLKIIDDIIRHRAADDPPTSILGYPRSDDSLVDYNNYTGEQLDGFVDNAAKHFAYVGLESNARKVVALLAASNLDFIVTWFALSRMGFTVLCLSLRLAPVAVVNLLEETGCKTVVCGQTNGIATTMHAVQRQAASVQTWALPGRDMYHRPAELPRFVRVVDREKERDEVALIMHSSGSTGLPKPVFLSHRNVLCHAVQGAGVDNFGALPLYHMYGVSTMLQAMYPGKKANMYNVLMPLTAENLLATIETVQPQAIHLVPYALGLLAEQPRGVEALQRCHMVTAAGARTPDELGDRLVRQGVKLGVVFGTTEAGLAGDTMRRAPGDDAWNYVRFYANVRQHIHMDPLGDQQFECVYLPGHPGLSTSNSEDPVPGCWRSRDVFTPHPTLPDAWKYVTRLDDRVTLLNGEKVLPLQIEGRIRESELVREAIVVGVDRPVPGLLVFRSERAAALADEAAYIEALWPVIADANARAEGFSQITRDMVATFGVEIEYPHTDKGSIIRARVYEQFAPEIEQLYARADAAVAGGLRLDLEGLEAFVRATYEDTVGEPLVFLEADFFAAGIDSLRALHMRRTIQNKIFLGGNRLETNVVYTCGNAKALAQHLHTLSTGAQAPVTNDPVQILRLIDKYSTLGETALLTGATGSLGAHLLAQLASSRSIRAVYCFVRASPRSGTPQTPRQRIQDSLAKRYLALSPDAWQKVHALEADASLPSFGLEAALVEQLRRAISVIFHVAWPVNFNIPLATFEPQLQGLRRLLQLSLDARGPRGGAPARLFFASSVSTAFTSPPRTCVPDGPVEDPAHAAPMGYAQSKFVGEQMVLNAARHAGARAYVLRIGQIVGDTVHGVWNDAEFIPALVRSSLATGLLPMLPEDCSWIPVDTLATAVLELSEHLAQAPPPRAVDADRPPVFYNMVNPATFPWEALLAELRAAGLQFETTSAANWLKALRQSAQRGEETANPAVKLLDYYEAQYGPGSSGEVRGGVTFETSAIQSVSQTMKNPVQVLEGGYVQKFVEQWKQSWLKA